MLYVCMYRCDNMDNDKKIILTDKAMDKVSDGLNNVLMFQQEIYKAKIQYENSLKKHKSNPFLD